MDDSILIFDGNQYFLELRDTIETEPITYDGKIVDVTAVTQDKFIFYINPKNQLVPIPHAKMNKDFLSLEKTFHELDENGKLSYRRKRKLLLAFDKTPPVNLREQVGKCLPLIKPFPPIQNKKVVYAMYLEFLMTEPTEKELEEWFNAYPLENLSSDQRTVVQSMLLQLFPNNAIEYIDDIWELYQKEKLLGSGGYGKVFKAINKKTGKTVALKFYNIKNKYTMDSIISEYHMGLLLRNKCGIYFSCTHRLFETDRKYITEMDYINGVDLFDAIYKLKDKLTLEHKLKISSDIIEITKALHRYNLVHRDIKPENIMYHYDKDPDKSYAILIDYNMVCKNEITEGNISPCNYEEIAGTDGFIDETRINNKYRFRFKDLMASDRYAVGVTLYNLWTGNKLLKNTPIYIDRKIPVYNLNKLSSKLKINKEDVVYIIINDIRSVIQNILKDPRHTLPTLVYT